MRLWRVLPFFACLILSLFPSNVSADSSTVTAESEWSFTVGEPSTVYIYGNSNQSCDMVTVDPHLWLYDVEGALIAQDDDGNHNQLDQCVSSKIVVDLEPGDYVVLAGYCCQQLGLGEVPDWGDGAYELVIADFDLAAGATTTTSTSTTTTIPETTTTVEETTTTIPEPTTTVQETTTTTSTTTTSTTTIPETTTTTPPTVAPRPPRTTPETTWPPTTTSIAPATTTTTIAPTTTAPATTTQPPTTTELTTSLTPSSPAPTTQPPATTTAVQPPSATAPNVSETAPPATTSQTTTTQPSTTTPTTTTTTAPSAIPAPPADATTEQKQAFEAEVNVFDGTYDDYVPSGSTVTVAQRRTIVAATITVSTVMPTAPSRRRK